MEKHSTKKKNTVLKYPAGKSQFKNTLVENRSSKIPGWKIAVRKYPAGKSQFENIPLENHSSKILCWKNTVLLMQDQPDCNLSK